MPRGDGTGPLGSGRSNCKGVNSGQKNGMGRNTNTNSSNEGSLEEQAARLEEQAANLRKLAKQNSKNI